MEHIHAYKIIQSTPNATVEVCTECKKKLITKQDKKGRIDNISYLKEHSRDVAQPGGATNSTFQRFYGHKTH